jgi:hypothetical protein
MTILIKLPIFSLLLCGLAACGGSGEPPIDEPPEPENIIEPDPDALAPSISEGNINSRLSLYDDVTDVRETGILPLFGSADYKGYMFTELEGDTPLANELHGTIYVGINFLGDDIEGDIRNLHTAMDGVPVEKLNGQLELTGEAGGTSGTFDATFSSSDVTGQVNFDEVQDLTISGTLDGAFRDVPTGNIFNPYDDGAAASGKVDLTIEGDTTVEADGTFYVRDRQYE